MSAKSNSTDGLHVGLIMDGNGRWATQRGQPRVAGHREGVRTVRRIVRAAPDLGVSTLTLYAFSSDNWRRPRPEVSALMRIFHRHLRSESVELKEEGVRMSLVGRRDRLPSRVLKAADEAEALTRDEARLHLRLAIDYSARDTLAAAAELLRGGDEPVTREVLAEAIGRAMCCQGATPDVDLMIRTSGEERLSDFLLWESAYAELLFTETLWPDFQADEFESCIRDFHGRDRRFGGLNTRAEAV